MNTNTNPAHDTQSSPDGWVKQPGYDPGWGENVSCWIDPDGDTKYVWGTPGEYGCFLHRENGPAIERADGGKEFLLFGKTVDPDHLPRTLEHP